MFFTHAFLLIQSKSIPYSIPPQKPTFGKENAGRSK